MKREEMYKSYDEMSAREVFSHLPANRVGLHDGSVEPWFWKQRPM